MLRVSRLSGLPCGRIAASAIPFVGCAAVGALGRLGAPAVVLAVVMVILACAIAWLLAGRLLVMGHGGLMVWTGGCWSHWYPWAEIVVRPAYGEGVWLGSRDGSLALLCRRWAADWAPQAVAWSAASCGAQPDGDHRPDAPSPRGQRHCRAWVLSARTGLLAVALMVAGGASIAIAWLVARQHAMTPWLLLVTLMQMVGLRHGWAIRHRVLPPEGLVRSTPDGMALYRGDGDGPPVLTARWADVHLVVRRSERWVVGCANAEFCLDATDAGAADVANDAVLGPTGPKGTHQF